MFDKNNDIEQFLTRTYNHIQDQLRLLKVKYDLFPHKPLSEEHQLRKVKSVGGGEKGLVLTPEPSRLNLSNIYCLDLDFSALRSLMISARRNELELLQLQIDRNRPLLKGIEEFIKNYYLFSHRPKVRSKLQLYASGFKKQVTGRSTRVKTIANDNNPHNFKKEKFRQRSYLKENIPEDTSRLAIKVNNVYVSGNEFDMYGENSGLKLTKLQQNSKRKATVFLTRALRDPLTLKINN